MANRGFGLHLFLPSRELREGHQVSQEVGLTLYFVVVVFRVGVVAGLDAVAKAHGYEK